MMEREGGSAGGRPSGTAFAHRGSARLAYEAVPAGTAGSAAAPAPAVIALHDLLADRASLGGLRDGLVTAGCRLVLPEMRGHGASAALAGRRYPMAELVADLVAVLDAAGVERGVLVGHGFGGAVALACAGRFRDRVGGLVLVEPDMPGLLADGGAAQVRWAAGSRREALRVAAAAAEKGQTDRALDALLAPRWGEGWRARLPRTRLGAVRRNAAGLGPLVETMAGYAPTAAELAAVAAPTLIVRAAAAADFARWTGDRLWGALPGARLVTVAVEPGGLGLGEAGAWGEVAALVERFLRGDGVGVGVCYDRGHDGPTN